MLKKIGFFREMGYPDQGSIHEAKRGCTHDPRVLTYLREGNLLVMSPGPEPDILDPEAGFAGTGSIFTDGDWAWPDDLIHYVQRYGFELPGDFLHHVVSRAYVVVPLTLLELRQLRF